MEYLQNLLDGSTVPAVTAFLLGLLTAISPCPLATNITAIGYISRDITNRNRIFRDGLLYALGRIAAYMLLGAVLIAILREGASMFALQKAISRYGEILLAPALILIGLFMLFGHKLKLPQFGFSHGDKIKKRGGWGALLLGVLFAMAFCPTSGIFYFGMLIPMSARGCRRLDSGIQRGGPRSLLQPDAGISKVVQPYRRPAIYRSRHLLWCNLLSLIQIGHEKN